MDKWRGPSLPLCPPSSPTFFSFLPLPEGSQGQGWGRVSLWLQVQGRDPFPWLPLCKVAAVLGECRESHGVWAMTLLLGTTGGPHVIMESGQQAPPPSQRLNQHSFTYLTDVSWGCRVWQFRMQTWHQREQGPIQPPQLFGCVTLG